MRFLRWAGLVLAILGATLLTQVGGLAVLAGWGLARWLRRGMGTAILGFSAVYAVLTLVVVPPLADLTGRERLPCFATQDSPYQAATPLLCVLNRTYVTPALHQVLRGLSADMARKFPGTLTVYLDGNFPFFDGFPLLPHLSHQDGRKLDIAFYYKGAPGELRSPIGYWAFEMPQPGEEDRCGKQSGPTLRWDMAAIQSWFPSLAVDEPRTRSALVWLSTEGVAMGVDRIFVEPHLVSRWAVAAPAIRFQGCRAARHDDHIHFQVK
ncbi:hypothetical protein ACFSM5_12590 [Lacibacterium aquatile]|uniref:Penicillin-insensitive murein endopeptidase n=1 Tax=Lacibacterium aquatile TaxID=1168082 RepID=A0ABW5DTA2_9PROT